MELRVFHLSKIAKNRMKIKYEIAAMEVFPPPLRSGRTRYSSECPLRRRPHLTTHWLYGGPMKPEGFIYP